MRPESLFPENTQQNAIMRNSHSETTNTSEHLSPASPERAKTAACLHELIAQDIADHSVNRRSFVQVLSGLACATAWVMHPESNNLSSKEADKMNALFGFQGVPVSMQDQVVVADGYVAEVLYRWGDPVDGVGPQFLPDASNSADDQERQAGMGHDGMEYFALPEVDPNQEGLLAINHEYTDQILLFPDGLGSDPAKPMSQERVRKSIASHGVSIIQVRKQSNGSWAVVPSPLARRITADTPMRISGPATTRIGTSVRGTVNNCAAGRTPWGTYLTCEENFQGVFGTNDETFKPDENQEVYGLSTTGYYYKMDDRKIPAYRWWDHYPRFDLSYSDNDSERFGYVVEIDPQRPEALPVKRTALGRFRHENAELTIAPDGRVVVYMGDDEVNQFVYKFVSKNAWVPTPDNKTENALPGDLLDEGTLYVARFDGDGTGRWLELIPGKNGIPTKSSSSDLVGFDEADICVRTRVAARIAGATPMDRAEWIAVDPTSKEVYVSLTNNRSRTQTDAANPRAKNIYGHIVRWRELNDDSTCVEFQWNVFALAGNPAHEKAEYRGNSQGDFFACPDGLKFDRSGILWIQTDMSSSVMGSPGYQELGNNMMLAANPQTGEVRRFLTGPVGCEITGMAMTPDRRTMFINIQHPGEPADEVSDPAAPLKYSSWPDGQDGGRPRSATIAIRKLDGGVIGG